MRDKGSVISEGFLTLVSLPTKGVKSLLSRNFNFPPFTLNKFFKFFAQESDLARFVGNGTNVKKVKYLLRLSHF